ncbi:MAG: cation:proton antiporter [Alphaproteobacteria bacterium]|nr:cation:proton antiporter [Alphaproteobacteria bacterium]
MDHTLIYTIIGSIVTAFAFGMIAVRLRLPPIFGYLLAGVAIGPHTPGFVADLSLAKQLAEIGVILLMFGVGLHFSVRDLLYVRRIALPGAIVQMLSATVIGAAVAKMFGYGLAQGLIFGFSLSVASTIVLLRSLEQRKMLESAGGKIAIGWLIVEDIAMVFALVMLPVLATMIQSGEALDWKALAASALEVTFKIGGFFAFMFIAGRRFLPWLLVAIARLRSSELLTLGTLAIALGFASIAYVVFHASFALGAFLAGMMLNESEIGRKSAESTLPMRDAFSVLFFVSVGMLFDPSAMWMQPVAVVAVFMIIVLAKSLAALAITAWFKQSREVSFTVAVGLAQIGEFSFILGGLALVNGLLSQELYNLILAGAMLSIVANPFLFHLTDALGLTRAKKQVKA